MISFTVLGQPVGKGRPRTRVVHGKGKSFAQIYTDSKTKQAENTILAQALQHRPASPIEGPIRLSVTSVFGVPASWSKRKRAEALAGAVRPTGKPDVDNLVKALMDALNGVFYLDDTQVVQLIAIKQYGEVPQTRVILEPLSPAPTPARKEETCALQL